MTQPPLPLDEDEREIWTVSEILSETRWALENTFTGLWVRGEVTGLRVMRSGHWYFGLKDEDAVLPVAMFQGDNRLLRFDVEDGMEVTACGRLSLYEPQGRFQLIANTLEPTGWGAQQLAFEQLKERLAREGLFAPERKRDLPALPRCVGVVTSARGAAWHDIRQVWERRQVSVRALLSPARVQGEDAPAEIIEAMNLLARHGEAEVLIVGRGGGSREDLWAFNNEELARTIANCPIPVVSAVGHEIDTTVADLVADRRAATPTAAAEIVLPSREELSARVESLEQRIAGTCRAQIATAARRLHSPAVARALREPARALRAREQRVDIAWDRLENAVVAQRERSAAAVDQSHRALLRHHPGALVARAERRVVDAAQRSRSRIHAMVGDREARLGTVAARVDAMSPLAVLGRGYALCEAEDGSLLRNAETVAVGDQVAVRLSRGRLRCDVTAAEPPVASD